MPESHVFLLELESLLNAFPDQGSQYQEGFLKTVLWRILEYKGDYYEKSGDDSRAIQGIQCLHWRFVPGMSSF